MTTNFLGLVQAFQYNVAGLQCKQVLWGQASSSRIEMMR